ncbi:conserved hypothetical protein [Trichinella spiralis]|uniref:hypothetical protein n=1 Tax=Trichinella spiralis TaxID=6334 RepID=UPI0001EFD3B1|nr:conserved hypothetical protein [Trichinella spiralis]
MAEALFYLSLPDIFILIIFSYNCLAAVWLYSVCLHVAQCFQKYWLILLIPEVAEIVDCNPGYEKMFFWTHTFCTQCHPFFQCDSPVAGEAMLSVHSGKDTLLLALQPWRLSIHTTSNCEVCSLCIQMIHADT